MARSLIAGISEGFNGPGKRAVESRFRKGGRVIFVGREGVEVLVERGGLRVLEGFREALGIIGLRGSPAIP